MYYLLILGMGLVVGYLTLSPLVILLASSFKETGFLREVGFTTKHYLEVYGDPKTFNLLKTSVEFAIGGTLIALLFGLTLAWIIERTDSPLKALSRSIVIIGMATPPVILGMSWTLLLSPKIGVLNSILMFLFDLKKAPLNIYSLPGMMFVQGLALVPTTFLMVSPAFRNMDPNLEDAALVSGAGRVDMLRRIIIPILRPSILGTVTFLFLVSLMVFDIPGVLGLPARIMMFSTQVYLSLYPAFGVPAYGQVGALASLYLIVAGFMAFLYVRFTNQAKLFVVVTGKGYRPKTMFLGKWKYVGVAFVLLYFLLAVGLPLATLLWASLVPYYSGFSRELLSSLSLNNYFMFFKHPFVIAAVKNTLIVTIVSATGVTSLAVIVSWIAFRSGVKGARILDVLSVLPLAIPAVLVGLALIYVYLTFQFIPIYGTIWILVIAYVTHYIPFGTRTTNGVIVQIHKELEEAAWLSGASSIISLVRIVIPLMIPALVSVWIWVAAHTLRELSAALLLMSYNNVVLSTLLWGYWENGRIPVAATVGVVLTTVLVFLIILLEIVRKRVQVM